MKLRAHDNSIRLRVSKSELADLQTRGWIENSIAVMPNARLEYRLEVTADGELSAALSDSRLTVRLPARLARTWYGDDEVSVHGRQSDTGSEPLEILIEKDFACLIPREGEDQSDLFPNPAKQPAGR
jgi:hypothetical protein